MLDSGLELIDYRFTSINGTYISYQVFLLIGDLSLSRCIISFYRAHQKSRIGPTQAELHTSRNIRIHEHIQIEQCKGIRDKKPEKKAAIEDQKK